MIGISKQVLKRANFIGFPSNRWSVECMRTHGNRIESLQKMNSFTRQICMSNKKKRTDKVMTCRETPVLRQQLEGKFLTETARKTDAMICTKQRRPSKLKAVFHKKMSKYEWRSSEI